MAAHEQHDQRVVLVGDLGRYRLLQRSQGLPLPPRLLASQLIEQPALAGLDELAARLCGNTFARPMVGGGQQRLLDGVLGSIEIAESPCEHADDLRRQFAQQVLDSGGHVQRSSPTC